MILKCIWLDTLKNHVLDPNTQHNTFLKTCRDTHMYLYVKGIKQLVTSCSSQYAVTGTPPSFDLEPQDTMVFQRNSASLTLNCSASGDPPPTIAWYREGTRFSDSLILANGSLLIGDITEGKDATRRGLSYHCTANNSFGTIRSRTAKVSYACESRRHNVCT